MSDDVPDRPGGLAVFLRAVNVERNAKVGFGIGVVIALALLALVVRGAAAAQYSVVYYVGLAFVLATGTGLLLTFVFTLGSLYRRARAMDTPEPREPRSE